MDQRGNFSAGMPNRMPPNFPRPSPISPALPSESSSSKKDNTLIFIIGGLLILFIVIGAIFFLISKDKTSEKITPSYEDVPEEDVQEITTGGCEKLGLLINSQKEYTCFDSENKLLKVYISRDLENVILKRINFTLYSDSTSINYSSDYGLAPGSFYVYQIGFNENNLEKIEIVPVVKDDGGEKECEKQYLDTIQPCVAEEVIEEPALEYTFDENMNVILANQSTNASVNQTESVSEWESFLNLFADKPQKKILNFSIDSVSGEIDEVRHRVFINFPDNRSIVSLIPSIQISANATISPSSGLARDFLESVIYTVTSSDGSTQNYTVYVSIEQQISDVPVIDNNVPAVYLYPIESNNLTAREIIFGVSDESNISQCTLYSGETIQGSLFEVNKFLNNSISVSNLVARLYSYSIKCNDSFGNLGVSNVVSFRVYALNAPIPVDGACGSANRSYTMNDSGFGSNSFCSSGSVSATPSFPARKSTSSWQCFGLNGGNSVSCSAKRIIITNVSGVIAGEWSSSANSLVAAELMAKLNKNYYILNIGAKVGCSLCKAAEDNVFSKSEFKQWAYNNGIAMVYSDDGNYDTDPLAALVRAKYKPDIFNLDKYPMIFLIGYESISPVATFVYRSGYNINGIIASLNPANFISIVDSYTQKYGVDNTAQFSNSPSSPVVTPDCTDGSCSLPSDIGSSNNTVSTSAPLTGSHVYNTYQDSYGTLKYATYQAFGNNKILATGAQVGEWTYDWGAAKALSKINGRPLILYFGAAGCAFCEQAKDNILTQSAFAKWAKDNKFIMVYANADCRIDASYRGPVFQDFEYCNPTFLEYRSTYPDSRQFTTVHFINENNNSLELIENAFIITGHRIWSEGSGFIDLILSPAGFTDFMDFSMNARDDFLNANKFYLFSISLNMSSQKRSYNLYNEYGNNSLKIDKTHSPAVVQDVADWYNITGISVGGKYFVRAINVSDVRNMNISGRTYRVRTPSDIRNIGKVSFYSGLQNAQNGVSFKEMSLNEFSNGYQFTAANNREIYMKVWRENVTFSATYAKDNNLVGSSLYDSVEYNIEYYRI